MFDSYKRLAFSLLIVCGIIAFGHRAIALETIAREAIIMDMETGAVLFEKDADRRMPPASMSKLMTLYILFERLRDDSLTLDDTFRI